MLFNLIIYSKNKKSLLEFFRNFEKTCKNNNIRIFYKLYKSKKNQKKILLLKSPHVNKTAQERFKIKTFFKNVYIYSPTSFKLLTFFKKYINLTLFDIFIKIKILINKNIIKKKLITFCDINNNTKLKKKNFKIITKKILKNFDTFGQLKLT